MARHGRRHKSRSRSMSGGQYTDAASYGTFVNGSTDAQYNRVFGSEYANVPGNVIIGAQGQNIPSTSQMPTSQQLSLVQQAGRRRRRGGFLGEVVNQAVVPFALLGAQQTYGRKRKGGRTKKNRGGFIGEVVNQAVVPFALLGAQQTYRRKRGGKRRTRRH